MLRRSLQAAAGSLLCAAVLLQSGLALHHNRPSRSLTPRDERLAVHDLASRGLARRDRKDTAGKGNDFTILLTSDSHGVTTDWKFAKMPDADVLIHCGDITDLGKIDEYKKVMAFFMAHPAKLKVFIGGNHDFTLDREYFAAQVKNESSPLPPELRKGKPEDLMKQAYAVFQTRGALKAGIKLLPEGLHDLQVLTKTGHNVKFRIFTSPYTPYFHNWAFSRPDGKGGFNTRGRKSYIPDGPRRPHFVITHGPPKGILDQNPEGTNTGEQSLFEAVKRVKPLFHAFGHIHEAAGVLRMTWKGGKTEPVTKNELDLTQPLDAIKKGDTTLFLNVAQRNLQKENANPWKLLTIKWRGAKKGAGFKDKNDPSRVGNKIKNWIRKPNNHA